jgi:hypothetical protein
VRPAKGRFKLQKAEGQKQILAQDFQKFLFGAAPVRAQVARL